MFARTNFLRDSPLFLAIYHWNKLPSDVVTVRDHDTFVSKLKEMWNVEVSYFVAFFDVV